MQRRRFPFATILLAFGLAFCAAPATAGTENILYSFQTTARGQYPSGGLISDSEGNLYGTTSAGGAFDCGTVFEIAHNPQGGWTESVLYDFCRNGGLKDGYLPVGSLALDAAGNLYGCTSRGGDIKYGVGTVFKLTHANGSWSESILWTFQQFSSTDGFQPQGGLVFDKAGNLYGTTEFGGGYDQNQCSFDGGCGTVFRLSPTSDGRWRETVLYVFQDLGDGMLPNGALAIDSSGHLYGTTAITESSGGGVFQLTPTTEGRWNETTLYTFTGGVDGDYPNGGLVFDPKGRLYGTTSSGGTGTACPFNNPCGTVFELSKGSGDQWSERVLWSFNWTDGAGPVGQLIFDKFGNIFGTADYGGTGGSGGFLGQEGVVFKLTPHSNGEFSETVLWNFTGGNDGENPGFGVIAGPTGELYGAAVTPLGQTSGINGNGTIFALTPRASGEWDETTLTNFPFADGGSPQASLIADASGNLYGTTAMGGAFGYGTVFKLARSGNVWQETTLYNFPNGTSAGSYSFSNASALVFDTQGNLYGETQYGGTAGLGNIFELSPSASGGWTARNLFNFTGNRTGGEPAGGLIFDSAGNLYGTTELGGNPVACSAGCGTVFRLSPNGGQWKETVLYRFGGGYDGTKPSGGVIFGQDGSLYGTTRFGGLSPTCKAFCGTVFKLSPSSGELWIESVLYTFTDAKGDGEVPYAGVIFDQAGNLYGTTANGGNGFFCKCGTAFMLTPNSNGWSETVLQEFDGSSAGNPATGVIMDQAGNLYGTSAPASSNGGTVFELSPQSGGGWSLNFLYVFPQFGVNDGASPQGGLTFSSVGTLYGTTAGGGGGGGIVFEIAP
jgi:uncharacterized repeat protein (TIGR03803 family)